LRCREGRRQRAGLQRAMDRSGGSAFHARAARARAESEKRRRAMRRVYQDSRKRVRNASAQGLGITRVRRKRAGKSQKGHDRRAGRDVCAGRAGLRPGHGSGKRPVHAPPSTRDLLEAEIGHDFANDVSPDPLEIAAGDRKVVVPELLHDLG